MVLRAALCSLCALALMLGARGEACPSRAPQLLIVYSTLTNHTKILADEIHAGAKSAGATIRLKAANEATFKDDVLSWADAVVLGSPVHFGQVSAQLLTWIEAEWASDWPDPKLLGKIGGVFATGGGMHQGLEHVLSSLARLLWSFGFQVVIPPPSTPYSTYGAGAVFGEPFPNNTLAAHYSEAARTYGELVATEARRRLLRCQPHDAIHHEGVTWTL
mmetsp:Transcript_48069/g.107929  ORF Transcript_48069/g.107929 Transcript_48069/m.107929 type:complete len:218 (-) Transcript_48069:26-679(-)